QAAQDVDAFYAQRERTPTDREDLLVLSCDAKGVVMRPEGLREQTHTQAQNASAKLKTRLSKGEKHARKRMAEIATVYELAPEPRTAADILPDPENPPPAATRRSKAQNKWLKASVTDDARTIIAAMFNEADRRDPSHQRAWVALVDGNNHQIDRIKREARKRKVKIPIVVDFIHVLEYLWSACWCFYKEGDPAAEKWVSDKARQVLDGKAGIVAAAIRRKATRLALEPNTRQAADRCADYLLAKRPYLDYPTALQHGWPIATGVIEGACRHLVKDRMDITGARWGLAGAEAILTLRALISNGDFDQYWTFHLAQEHRRVHASRYALGVIPTPA
ncbi:MAG: ISKra4 family transposase, partial [Solirubrobacteraceae bacterium]